MSRTTAAAPQSQRPNVGIVGGGLAGLAAAAALCERGFRVEVFEARRKLGGRAGSYVDGATGETVDHCQHVGMGCCTELIDFCAHTGVADLFRRHRTLYFFGPDGRRYDFGATPLLPAPLHLGSSFLRLGYLSWNERWRVARTLLQLRAESTDDDPQRPTIGQWLRERGESERAIRRFWGVVLVSALGESVERAALPAARKTFVDGFMSSRDAYHLLIPTVPLGTLYDRIAAWLQERGVRIHLETPVECLVESPTSKTNSPRTSGLQLNGGERRSFDNVVVAVPWRRVRGLFPETLAAAIPELATVDQIDSSPISSLHLWFDHPIMPLPHAVLIDRMAQWVFARELPTTDDEIASKGHYYQVVISASHDVRQQPRDEVLATVLEELRTLWPAARDARLLHWRMITENDAVFSVRPGLDRIRPLQRTAIANVALAGDWTKTGWPATMESAVRSGRLAAAAIATNTTANDA